MTIKTIQAGDLPGILAGWVGPVNVDGRPMILWLECPREGPGVFRFVDGTSGYRVSIPKLVTINLAWAPVRDRIVRWAAEGERCACTIEEGDSPCTVHPSCPACGSLAGSDGTWRWCDGWQHRCADSHPQVGHSAIAAAVRPPADIAWARDKPAALRWAALRVARGLPVLGAMAPWVDDNGTNSFPHLRMEGGRDVYGVDDDGWHCWYAYAGQAEWTREKGPETGDHGKAAADRAAMAAGWWLEGGPFEVST